MTSLKTITFKHIVGGTIMLAFITGHIAMLFIPIPDKNDNPFIHSLGMLDTAVAVLVGYYFGSSSGSKQKSEIIEEELDKKTS